ncbi:DUF2971 domain-containing protein [Vibrio sp. Y2-5]|uniref:DUF2971 domain-containing protein n=1 Tax=Vibrio sp. Y2-5 TaxID=2743977 RepID=UPI0016600F3D|nr:DUF2971 domain-containing protein [Vibrio sp. Y2-5]MBD0786734.1 DUF2971 domain-containing protein [Vibrio sp. Y2-5]
MEEQPKYFYKYCPTYDVNKIIETTNNEELKAIGEYSLANLFNHTSKFTSRTAFNDPFDTKIKIHTPNKHQIRELLRAMPYLQREKNRPWMKGEQGKRKFDEYLKHINQTLDSYVFYCVTPDALNNLMWSHYANEHHGFCIEWESDFMQASKVTYLDSIGEFEMIRFIRSVFFEEESKAVGDEFWRIMRIKLKEWAYENEYRLQLSNKNIDELTVTHAPNFKIVRHEPKAIKSIIFGGRMDVRLKRFIRDRYNNDVTYKEAFFKQSSIGIRPAKF